MHPGNIIWGIDNDGDVKQELEAIIDWQTMHEGSPMEDLARFLAYCADGVVRRQSEAIAFDYYIECLTKEFEGDSSKVPYTSEQLKKSYNLYFVSQAFFTIFDFQFFFSALEGKISSPTIKDAYHDYGVLKSLHCIEDADKILQSTEFRHFYDKYG
uniref:Uncharacterized protein n=1 Tax=Panagrolaimus superbus TaxID=310955 RepID=A0A914XYY2_9BILA